MNSPLITVLYDHGIENVAPEAIYRIPKKVATHFSPVLRDCFPRANQHHVNRPGCDGATVVTVSGSVKLAYVAIFQWMLNSCQENGRARLEYLPFSKCAHSYEAAEMLGVGPVEREMLSRMSRIASTQVPCEDVRMVYATYPKESVVRQIVIRSIGDAILNRRLRRWSAYLDLRVDSAEYDNDIHEYIQARKREWRELQRAEKDQTKGKKQRRPRRSQDQQEATEKVVGRQVAAPLARKGKGGQPSYYTLQLGELGVSSK